MAIYDALTCSQYIDVLGSNAPTPGGGGAAAYITAVGCALGSMVGSITMASKRYADVHDEMQGLLERSTALQEELLQLAERDASVFEPVIQAWRIKPATPEEEAEKERIVQERLSACCEVPLHAMECCCQAIDLLAKYAEKGSGLARSDAGCGAVACKAGLQAAYLSVLTNTHLFADRSRAEALNRYAGAMRRIYEPKADAVFAAVEVELS